MINPSADRAKYRQIADELRQRITTGRYPPGTRFPSEQDIQQEFGAARTTAREAMRLLAQDGLIVIKHGQPTRVSNTRPMSTVPVPPGHLIGARPATEREAAEWSVAEGSPVLVVLDEATGVELDAFPADRTRLRPVDE